MNAPPIPTSHSEQNFPEMFHVSYLAVFTAFSQVGIMFQSLGQMSSRSEVHYKLFV